MPSFREKMAFHYFTPMKTIKTVYFIKSAVTPDQYPQHALPEIAFIGRSNVGKSSLLNTLVNKKNLARISNTPGRTQLINFFNIDEKFCFVDLPGYGYAKVPEHIKQQWKPMIESYLLRSQNLKRVVLILDARHKPTRQDLMMREWLQTYQRPMILVATKIDKIAKSKRQKQIRLIKETLHTRSSEQIFPFSAFTHEGFKEIWHAIFAVQTVPT
jgi:GTP-binding protein